MIRLAVYIAFSLAAVAGLAWLISLDGSVTIDLGTWRLQPGLGSAAITLVVLILAILILWSIIRRVLNAPRALARRAARRAERRGVEALSDGFIALQAGDADRARRLAREAQNRLPGNDAALLLEARADLALGEWGTAREEYRALIDNPKTSMAALSGLYEQAIAQHRPDAALTFAHKAHAISPQVGWANKAVFDDLIDQRDWAAALTMVEAEPARQTEERDAKKHRQAVLNAAIAVDNEDSDPVTSLDGALAALKIEPGFVPAALVAARIYANRGEVRRATSLLKRVWRDHHHPDLARLYANAQPGISPEERLKRVGELIPTPPKDGESAVVVARLAIDANVWVKARNTLANFAPAHATRNICLLMAEIEEGQDADFGRARQWLSRAAHAPLDATWTADGITMDEWDPVSAVTGRFDAFEWKQPVNDGQSDGTAFPAPSGPESHAKSLPPNPPDPEQSDLAQPATRQ